MKSGWILLYRELLDKTIWKNSTPEQKTILITLLLIVNFSENEWEWEGKKFYLKPGQVITSLNTIARASGKRITIQNVRTALKRFENLGFLTNQPTNQGRLISICNWEKYQSKKFYPNTETNNPLTTDSQITNKPLTPNKESERNYKEGGQKSEVGTSVVAPHLVVDLINLFCEVHNVETETDYLIINKAKESAAAKKIIKLYRIKNPQDNDSDMLSNLKIYFEKCFNIKDNWYRNNMSLPIILSKTNEINKIINHGNSHDQKCKSNFEREDYARAIYEGTKRALNNNSTK